MDAKKAKAFLENQKWIYAKTYAKKAPHEYCLRKNVVGTDGDFNDAVQYIRDNGFKALFWGREYTYLKIGDNCYWTMGAPINETILINRCNYAERFESK